MRSTLPPSKMPWLAQVRPQKTFSGAYSALLLFFSYKTTRGPTCWTWCSFQYLPHTLAWRAHIVP